MEPSPETSSRKPLDRPAARACLIMNLLALPGLGTWIAGRRAGLLQMALSILGVFLGGGWLALMFREWMIAGVFPNDPGPCLWMGVSGLLLIVFTWIWGLASGLSILKEVQNPG